MALPFRSLAVAAGLTVLFSVPLAAQEVLPPPKPVVTLEPGIRVAEQGPIHEGFAQPGAQVRGADLLAPKSPPPPVPELPPETKPAGNDVRWVGGYWMWEDAKQDFTWVSGFWRDVPPGRDWSPGEWKMSGDQYRYEPGFWKPTTQSRWRIDLPQPPKPLNAEPNQPAPHAGMTWMPGEWVYNESTGQYAWQAGYWSDPPGNMVYTPGQYRTTDYGYAYAPGYWDYCLEDRGLLYAPVYFDRPLWANRGWYYRPQYALNIGYGNGWGNGNFFASLSIGPGFGSYYYGPYGSGWSAGLGLVGGGFLGYSSYPHNYPWYYTGGGYYNPLWRHYNTLNANNPAYATHLRQSAVAASFGYNGIQSVAPLSRATTTATSGAGVHGPAIVHVPANTAWVTSPKLVQPAQHVLTQQQVAIRPATPVGIPNTRPVFTASPPTNAIGQGMSGQRQVFREDIGTFTPGSLGRGPAPATMIRPSQPAIPNSTFRPSPPSGTLPGSNSAPRTGPVGPSHGGGSPPAGGSRGNRGRG